ncbi:hypothetical protein BRD20_10285 [Halobacteriales archaeon SW_8_65_20]|nr:MAG: hypothetical protein BRD20_10285 [Halobacteriales archaeon SW_8_65_20]
MVAFRADMNWVDTISEWQTHSVADGYAGLHELADADFSGGVAASDAWLLFVNGTPVSVTDHADGDPKSGEIEAFDSSFTAHEAPHPSLPLLAAMQFGECETRAKYYTEDTPLDEVESTLEDGGFTGYIELSENVLSGDYYTIYQGGRSMHVAFVGSSSSVVTDDEARDDAHDEVGLYEVVAAPIDVVEIPDAPEPTPEPAAGPPSTESETESEQTATPADGEPDSSDSVESATEPVDPTPETGEPATTDTSTDSVSDAEAPETGDPTDSEPDEPSSTDRTPGPERPSQPVDREPATDAQSGEQTTDSDSRVTDSEPGSDSEATGDDPTRSSTDASGTSASSSAATASATEQLAARSIPSVDPERTASGRSTGRDQQPEQSSRSRQPPQNSTRSQAGSETVAAVREELETAREQLRTAKQARDDARTELETTREELQRAETAREELAAERDELQTEVESLRARVDELESQLGTAATDGPSLSPPEAFDETNLFVRYESKGKTTVESAHGGEGTAAELAQNLRLVYHTQFETDGATVDGEPFEEWLYATQQYRFVEWLVGQLVFEIRETETTSELSGLYDALPAVDRVELSGEITVNDGAETVDIDFDIVCRDQMGEPLFVADLDTSRQPVSAGQMASLVQDSELVCETESAFAGAFFVSAAFFEPGALETASDATSGSLLSRDSRLSYVKRSRKRGYHLALIESRDDGFHLSVPDI